MTTIDEPVPETDVEELEEQLPLLNAPNNAGQLALINYGGQHQHITKQVKGLRDAYALTADYVSRTLESLVEREFRTAGGQLVDSARAEWLLRAHHILVLVGKAGTGRRTAAIGVLGRLGLPLQEIPAWDPGQPGQFTVSDLPAAAGEGYLFRHPNGESAAPEFRDQLQSYVGELRRRRSHLVLVVTPTEWQAIGAATTENVLSVVPPPPGKILVAEVRARAGHHDLQPVLDDERVSGLIGQATPRDVIRLADLVLATADMPDREQAVLDVIGAFKEWSEVLTRWFEEHQAARDRIFLLAAAVLEEAPARLVLRYAEQLGEEFEGTRTGRYDIASAGIRELADRISAEVTAADHRLRFKRHAYGTAVLDFFLADRSDTFRIILRNWFAKAPGDRRSPEQVLVAEAVAAAVLGIMIRHRHLWFLNPVINAWASNPGLRPALVTLLTGAALSPEVGSQTRQRLNQWAGRSSSPSICQIVAEVCSGDLADVYPQVALTRINNLAIRGVSVTTAEAVALAVLRLWERPALRRDVMGRVLAWLTEPDSPAFAVATVVLAALGPDGIWAAHEHRLDTGPALRALLQRPGGPPEELRDTLYGWLDLAVADSAFADWLVGAVTDAIPGPAPALMVTAVRVFTHEWQGGDAATPRGAFRERLLERITVVGWEAR